MSIIKNLINSTEGATAIEYALLAALIGVFCIGSFTFLGEELSLLFADSSGSVSESWDRSEKGSGLYKK
jgi:Flp pilus assembly pilin Flp